MAKRRGPPSQGWWTLRGSGAEIAAMDHRRPDDWLETVDCFVVVRLDRRATAAGTECHSASDLSPNGRASNNEGILERGSALHDPGTRNCIFGVIVTCRNCACRWAFGTSPSDRPRPGKTASLERLIVSIRCECVDDIMVLSQEHPTLILLIVAGTIRTVYQNRSILDSRMRCSAAGSANWARRSTRYLSGGSITRPRPGFSVHTGAACVLPRRQGRTSDAKPHAERQVWLGQQIIEIIDSYPNEAPTTLALLPRYQSILLQPPKARANPK